MDENNFENPQHNRLLSIGDVAKLMNFTNPTASVFIDETGKAINTHRRKFIFEDDLMGYLRELAGEQNG